MEKVLKRVGLSKRTQLENKSCNANETDESVQVRRRRRSKTRRRTDKDTKKTRRLFNIDWESVKDCKSCQSRAISKRFCSKRCDNELYRSNSFKFERFVRGSEEVSTLEKKISLCEDYSLPVDHLNKKRPNSIAVPISSEWNVSSPSEENVKILEAYSTPRDSKQQLSQEEVNVKCFTSPDREYSQPYTTEGSSEISSDDEFFGHQISVTKVTELNSPDSITEAILPLVNVQSPTRVDIKRHPSPYYYADLYKIKTNESTLNTDAKIKKEKHDADDEHHLNTFQISDEDIRKNPPFKKKYNKHNHKKYQKSSSLDNSNLVEGQIRAKDCQLQYKRSYSIDTENTSVRDVLNETAHPNNKVHSACICVIPDNDLDDEMSRQRHLYETAFDCRISKSDDDLDRIDQVSNHPILFQANVVPSVESSVSLHRHKVALTNSATDPEGSISRLSQNLHDMHLPIEETSTTSGALPLRGYTPSPPSTAPLPTKFHCKELIMNSIKSAPNLPHPKARCKDLHLPVKSLRGRSPTSSSGSFQTQGSAFNIEFGCRNEIMSDFKERLRHSKEHVNRNRVLEIKDRPRKSMLLLKRSSKDQNEVIVEYKGRRRRHKYSSMESMTTSSSGGSMESIKSSTSEGNRSTTSSESHRSSSLSSHSSDSCGNTNFPTIQSSVFLTHSNKLHILSPISDKSSQEPISETSDNNRNNNSQKCSPEEAPTPENLKPKRRPPQNRNLLNLGFQTGDKEIQGSDSGISIQSREGIKSRSELTTSELSAPSQQDLGELPFDMPKLRRRRMTSQDACTSVSSTSVDLKDLPFDMPKLRRRLRTQQSGMELSVSQASSSQSVVEADRPAPGFRSKLTLNLGEFEPHKHSALGLTLVELNGIHSEKSGTNELIDINVPLEKQGWFHGTITRVEAENVLRLLQEGSFLVRNSESMKQDYSLSLKSARGFMHMRIQKNNADGTFILGQFSKPFSSIPVMIRHFSLNRLPIRGAEHMCLIQPVIAQLL